MKLRLLFATTLMTMLMSCGNYIPQPQQRASIAESISNSDRQPQQAQPRQFRISTSNTQEIAVPAGDFLLLDGFDVVLKYRDTLSHFDHETVIKIGKDGRVEEPDVDSGRGQPEYTELKIWVTYPDGRDRWTERYTCPKDGLDFNRIFLQTKIKPAENEREEPRRVPELKLIKSAPATFESICSDQAGGPEIRKAPWSVQLLPFVP